MQRDDLLREISRLDKEINLLVTETELPQINYVPFPSVSWFVAGFAALWAMFGGMIPQAEALRVYKQFGSYGYLAAAIFAVLASIRTFQYFLSKSTYSRTSGNYRENSLRIQELQAKRRDLQIELTTLSE